MFESQKEEWGCPGQPVEVDELQGGGARQVGEHVDMAPGVAQDPGGGGAGDGGAGGEEDMKEEKDLLVKLTVASVAPAAQ